MNEERLSKVFKEEAYNTQFHGITSQQLVDRLRLPFEQECRKAIDELQDQLIQNGEDRDEVSTAAQSIQPRLFREDAKKLEKKELADFTKHPEEYAKIDRAFDSLAAMTHVKYLHVPDNIVLPEDSNQSTTKNPSITLASHQQLYNKILEEKQLATHLDDRLAELEAVKDQLEQSKRELEKLEALVS